MSQSFDQRDFAQFETDARNAARAAESIVGLRQEIGRLEEQITVANGNRQQAASQIGRASSLVEGKTITIERGSAIAGGGNRHSLRHDIRMNLTNHSGTVERMMMAEDKWMTVGLCIVFVDYADGHAYALLHRGAIYHIS